ncbi:glycosyltransferase family 25 protein [Nonomuraea sp. NPDC050328]|uniref:glycosyltransferase family 25 protein n=1 Tax=Nonomuraea sp. NPDC050328 TaxID=3364361 RepID=UPI0037BE1C60
MPVHLPTFVVNLRRRPDRRERIAAQLSGHVDASYTSDWDGLFDGADITRQALANAGHDLYPWAVASPNPWWNRPLRLGEIGCTLSHLACWREGASTGAPYFMVLEDDATLFPSFFDQLAEGLAEVRVREQPGLIYLARCPMEADEPAWPGFVRPGFSYCTWGYLLSHEAALTLLAAGLDRALMPIDEFLPAMYMEHPRPDVRARFSPRISALAFDPPLLETPEHVLGDSDTEASDAVCW